MKTKTKFLALLSVLVLLLTSLFGLGVPLLARADGADAGEPERKYTSLYYFSDYYQSEEYYYNGFIRDILDEENCPITYSELNYWNNSSDRNGFWDKFRTYEISGYFSNINNAVVIVEIRNSFRVEPVSCEEERIMEKGHNFFLLENVFSRMKEQNCQIMFICGLDEDFFDYNEYNAFLDYVDIHIDVDFASTYAYTMLYELTDGYWDYGLSVPTTVIFDSRLPQKHWMYRMMATYFLYLHGSNPMYSTEEQPFLDYGLAVFLYDHETGGLYSFFKYYADGELIGISEEEYNCYIADAERLYIAGNSQAEDLMRDEIEYYDLDFVYLLVDYPYATIDYYLDLILRDMIAGYDLSQHDNRDGRCDVTFKPLFGSSDGRLREPNGESWYDIYPNISEMDPDELNQKPYLFVGIFG